MGPIDAMPNGQGKLLLGALFVVCSCGCGSHDIEGLPDASNDPIPELDDVWDALNEDAHVVFYAEHDLEIPAEDSPTDEDEVTSCSIWGYDNEFDCCVSCFPCDGMVTSHGTSSPELHIIAIDRASDRIGFNVEINVDMLYSGIIFVLSGCEPINWSFNLHPLASIERVFLLGNSGQRISGLTDVPVEHIGTCCGSDWWDGPRIVECMSLAESSAGVSHSSQARCAEATSFTFRHVCFDD